MSEEKAKLTNPITPSIEARLMAGERFAFPVAVKHGTLRLTTPGWGEKAALDAEYEGRTNSHEYHAKLIHLMAKEHTPGLASYSDVLALMDLLDVRRVMGLAAYLLNLVDELPKELAEVAVSVPAGAAPAPASSAKAADSTSGCSN